MISVVPILKAVIREYRQHCLRSLRPVYQSDVFYQSQPPVLPGCLWVDDKAVYFVSDSWEEESARAGIREALLYAQVNCATEQGSRHPLATRLHSLRRTDKAHPDVGPVRHVASLPTAVGLPELAQ